jgi:DnaK suppressor protein
MNSGKVKGFRKRLLRELADVAESVRRGKSNAEDAEQSWIMPDEADLATANSNRAIINSVTDGHAYRLKSIEQAIQRIDRGDYGSCRRCEEDIHVKRLKAMPWATLCLQCQAELENARPTPVEGGFEQFHPVVTT